MAKYEVITDSDIYEVDTLEKPKPSLYSEVGAPFTHALSLIAGDIPKAIGSRDISPEGQEAYRALYPEQQTGLGKALRFATNVPAFAVGLPGKAALGAGKLLSTGAAQFTPKFAGKALAGRAALRAGEFGASQAAIAPKKGEDYAGQVGTAVGFGMVAPGAGLLAKSIGKSMVGMGIFTAKTFGGITDFSRETIKRLGSARVFEPAKQSAGYIGEVVVPKVKSIISQKIADGRDKITLRNIGLNDEQVNWLLQLSPIYKNRLSKVLNGENINIKQGIEAIKGDAHNRFSALMSRVNPNTAIDIKTFYNNLKNTLVKQGWIDRSGQEVIKYGRNPVRDQLLSIYGNLTRSVKTDTGGYRKYVLNVPEYENVRNALTTAVSGNPQNDRLLFELGGKLRESAANTIKGLPEVNKLYSDAERLAEIEGKGLFSKILNPEKMEAEIIKLRNIDKPNQVARIKSIIGKDLADDVDAHLAVMDLGLVTQGPGISGGIFPGPSGIKKALLSGVTQKYYRDIYPQTQKVKGLYEALRTLGEEFYKKPLFGKSLLNQSRPNILRSQSGSAYIGGQNIQHPSRIYKVLAQNPQETWTPQQLRGFLSGKVSQNELDTLLTPELMAKPKIMKADVLQSIETNMPQIEVVKKGEKISKLPEFEEYKGEKVSNIGTIQLGIKFEPEVNQYRGSILTNRGFDFVWGDNEAQVKEKIIQKLNNKFPDLMKSQKLTKFSQWQLPGGTNYQETLIKVPINLSGKQKIIKRPDGHFDIYENKKPQLTNIKTRELAEEYLLNREKNIHGSQVFKSSHFDEPNVLAHVRHNDRVTPQGEKVRFLEEIQSDWATEQRKGGKNVPSHPLIKNWQELTLKQALKDAADTDAKYLSWTTGEQQAARYDLSKQVDYINWSQYQNSPNSPIRKEVNLRVRGGDDITVSIDKEGKVVHSTHTTFDNKPLSEVIGKDATEKILTGGKNGTLTGKDLKIGGEWAKNLYDKQIPNILKKLTGQDVEMIKIDVSGKEQPAVRLTPELKAQIKGGYGKTGELFGILGPTMATGLGLATALRATSARGETGDTLDPKYKQQIANAENYGKIEGDWAQLEDIVLRDLKRIGKLKQNITLEQVRKDPQLYDKVVKLYWDRLDTFGIPEKDKALWWLMPGRYRQTGGDISRLKNPEHRNIMRNRVKNIGGRK